MQIDDALLDWAGQNCCASRARWLMEIDRLNDAIRLVEKYAALISAARSDTVTLLTVRGHLANGRIGLATATIALAKKYGRV